MLSLVVILAAFDPQLVRLGAPEHDRALKLQALADRIGAKETPLERFCDDEKAPCPLAAFFAKLAQLEAGTATAPVRVVHFGDSQIASDYITELIRRRLALRFGSGGKGYLFVAKPSQLSGKGVRAATASEGWLVDKLPIMTSADRVAGFSGASFSAKSGERFEVSIGDARKAEVFFYATKKSGELLVKIDEEDATPLALKADVSAASSATIELPAKGKLLTLTTKGNARLFGIALENQQPGVIYDSIGLPGADFEYWLRTDEAAFVDQLQRRDPSLVVLALGGAEVYRMTRGWTNVKRIEEKTMELIARVRKAAPNAECLVWSPLSRGAPETHTARKETLIVTPPLRAAAKAAGCAFWSALDAMGGVGAAVRWHDRSLMNSDLVHPRQTGADVIGHLFDLALIRAYEASGAAPPPPELALGLHDPSGKALERTYAKLRALEAGEIDRFALLHLGASHTAAQLLTDEARSILVKRFGDRGRGFIELGHNEGPWRRAGVVRKMHGAWAVKHAIKNEPGVFSLTGLRAEGEPGASVSLDLCHGCAPTKTKATLDLFYVDEPNGALEITLDGRAIKPPPMTEAAPTAKVWSLPVRGVEHTLSVRNAGSGLLSLFGAAIERQTRGLVYDPLGLPGATAYTANALDKPAFVTQLKARRADLYLLFYGTNEASIENFAPEDYAQHYRSLLATLREAAPEADCLIMGPSDRMRPTESGRWETVHAQAAVESSLRSIAEQERCAFWSTLANMGGRGAADRWARVEPQLAKRDRVHLTELGYRAMGRRLMEDFLAPLQPPPDRVTRR